MSAIRAIERTRGENGEGLARSARSSAFARLVRRFDEDGPMRTVRYLRHRLAERAGDFLLGVRTEGRIAAEATGVANPDSMPYCPIAYRSFQAVMGRVPVRANEDVFLDYGAGKGRVVVLAARLPFKRVIGVEIAPGLSATARANVRRAERRLRCRDVAIVTADAAQFELPDDVTVIHFFDPFREGTVTRVLERIHESLLRAPREITILYADTVRFGPIAASRGWIEERGCVPYPYTERGGPPERYRYGIYRASAAAGGPVRRPD